MLRDITDMMVAIQLTVGLVFVVAIAVQLASLVRGASFLPTGAAAVDRMISMTAVRPGEKVVDLGSGDGRIVIAFAKAGAEAHGYEINPLLVWWSRRKITQERLSDQAFIHWRSFWKEDLSPFDVVVIFGMVHIMRPLEKKLRRELAANTRVVAYVFTFPTWRHAREEDRVYLYEQT